MSSDSMLPKKMGSGPKGLGNPDDKSLRRVEIEVLIPKVMRERANEEKCVQEVKAFTECCSTAMLASPITCRKQNSLLKNCMIRWYQDEEFKKECTEIYLKRRSEYRSTGIKLKKPERKPTESMGTVFKKMFHLN